MALPYLHRRGSSWQFRFRVPQRFRTALGKGEIVKSFGPVSRSEAHRLWRAELIEVQGQIEALERHASGTIDLKELSDREIASIVRLYFASLEQTASEIDLPFSDIERDQRIEANLEELASISQPNMIEDSSLQHVAKAAARIGGVDLATVEGQALSRLSEAVLAALIEHHHRQDDRLNLRMPQVRDARFSNEALARDVSPRGTTLSALVTRWATERQPVDKTIAKMERVISHFEAVNGAVSVESVSTDHVMAYREALLASGVSRATAQNKLGQLNTLFRLAVETRIITQSPTDGFGIRQNAGRTARPRTAFDAEALNLLFKGNVFSEGARPTGGGGEAAYWMPLIALFSGARQREIAQLRPDDIVEEVYFDPKGDEKSAWVMRLRHDPENNQRLKTSSSERRVPLHPVLLERGFLELVASAKANGDARIFRDLRPDKWGNPAGNWSKWFGRYLRASNVTDRRLTFHSFRHTFKDISRLSGIANDVHNEITGHKTGDVGDGYGGDRYPLGPLVSAINAFRIPGLVLPDAPQEKD